MTDEVQFDMEKVNALPTWNINDYLTSPEMTAAYLTECLDPTDSEDGNVGRILAGELGKICRHIGTSEIAEKTGFARESLYKALSGKPNSRPELNTIMKVLDALGLKLVIVPIKEEVKQMAEVLDPLHASYLLSNKIELASFLEDLLREGDNQKFNTALGILGKAYGMQDLAEKMGMNRSTAYMAFSETGNPSFKQVTKMLDVLGIRLSFFPQ